MRYNASRVDEKNRKRSVFVAGVLSEGARKSEGEKPRLTQALVSDCEASTESLSPSSITLAVNARSRRYKRASNLDPAILTVRSNSLRVIVTRCRGMRRRARGSKLCARCVSLTRQTIES